jgi:hypothetical protein
MTNDTAVVRRSFFVMSNSFGFLSAESQPIEMAKEASTLVGSS